MHITSLMISKEILLAKLTLHNHSLANEFPTTGHGLAFSYEKNRSYMGIEIGKKYDKVRDYGRTVLLMFLSCTSTSIIHQQLY